MLDLNLTNFLYTIAFFNLIFVAFIAFFLRTGKPMANQLFALFLFAKGICFTTSFFYNNWGFALTHFIHVFYIGTSFDLLLGPLFLFYLKSLTHKSFKIKRVDLLHFIPFLIHIVYMTLFFHTNSLEDKQHFLENRMFLSSSFIIINEILVYTIFIIYSIFIIKEILLYHINVKERYANYSSFQMNWMLLLTLGLAIIWLMAIVSAITALAGNRLIMPMWAYIVPVFMFCNLIFFFGIRYTSVFGGIEINESIRKYKKTAIPSRKKDELLEKLLEYIETEKPYLQPDINISKLAEQLAVPSYQLSQILNTELNKNFFEFISYYRIKESMLQLSRPENKSKTILEILYEVGFNSKSAFNNAFKKHTGVTPTQYKKQPEAIDIPALFN